MHRGEIEINEHDTDFEGNYFRERDPWYEGIYNVVEDDREDASEDRIIDCSNIWHKKAYRAYVTDRYGYLGKGRHVQFPVCILRGIRLKWSPKYGQYMGFKDYETHLKIETRVG